MSLFPEAPFENAPASDQKERLEDFLAELKILCRKYALLVETTQGETQIVDLVSETVIGIGLFWLLDQQDGTRIRSLECMGSILDGVWLVNGPDGYREQYMAKTVWPHRENPPQ